MTSEASVPLYLEGVRLGTLLGSAVAWAGEDSDSDRSHPVAFVKDSAITTAIKAKLAGERMTSLARVHVDTDKDGVVWLTGSARTQEAADKAASIGGIASDRWVGPKRTTRWAWCA
jgi:hyperosmotically inducible periplasmic protein